jgi:hypothetical protein
MLQQYWVIGGEFRCLQFQEINGAAQTAGPFESYEAAETVWRERTEASRSSAATRFMIVTTAPNPRRILKAA